MAMFGFWIISLAMVLLFSFQILCEYGTKEYIKTVLIAQSWITLLFIGAYFIDKGASL